MPRDIVLAGRDQILTLSHSSEDTALARLMDMAWIMTLNLCFTYYWNAHDIVLAGRDSILTLSHSSEDTALARLMGYVNLDILRFLTEKNKNFDANRAPKLSE